jgi:hypothetical protein
MAAQAIVRGSKSLAISQLEIAVVAFATCAIIIYALNWFKPKGVSVPFVIMSFPSGIPQEVINAVLDRGGDLGGQPILSQILGLEYSSSHRIRGSPIPNDWDADQESLFGVISLIFGTAIFGGLHLGAWNFHFPTTIELILWRATSLFCTVYGFAFILVFAIGECWSCRLSLQALSILYALARLFLLVEIFRTLLFLPPDAYKSTWAINIPHLA